MKRLTIGIITPDLDGDYFIGLMRAIIGVLQQDYGARVLVVASRDNLHYGERLALNIADGWISILSAPSAEFREALERRGTPLVGVGFPFEHYPHIIPNNRKAFAENVQHLIGHGHRRIAFVGYISNPDIAVRLEGYKDALAANAIAYDPSLVIRSKDALQPGGRLAAQAFLELADRPTAAAVATDMNAFGFMEVLQEQGIRVPEEIAVTGFDNLEYSRWSKPQLTTTEVFLPRIGQQAVHVLMDRIHHPSNRSVQPYYVDHKTCCRRSCGCPDETMPQAKTEDGEQRDYRKRYRDLAATIYRVMTSLKIVGRELVASSVEPDQFLDMLFANYHFSSCLGLAADGEALLAIRCHDLLQTGEQESTSVAPEGFPPLDFLLGQTSGRFTVIFPMRQGDLFFGAIAAHVSLADDFIWKIMDMFHHATTMYVASLERERLVRELRAQEVRYRELAEILEIVSRTTNDGILVWQRADQQYHCNQQLVQLLALPEGAFQGAVDRVVARVHPEDQAKLWAYLRENPGRETRRNFELEVRVQHTHGRYFWVFTAGECLYDEDANLTKVIASVKDITERKEAEEKINYMAYHDMLTGLPNRSLFFESLEAALREATVEDRLLAVLVLDTDRFKMINDTFGHLVGDRLLQHTSDCLRRSLPAGAVPARLGGDEFAVLLPEVTGKDWVMAVIREIHRQFEAPFLEEGTEIFTKTSIGLAIYPLDGQTQEELLRVADERMYRAKYEGRS